MAARSEEDGYLFIMSPRTGCTALSVHLVASLGAEWCPPQDVLGSDGEVIVPRKHSTLRQLLDGGVISEDEAARLLKFCAVRNPFDSLVSLHRKLTRQYLPLLDDEEAFIHREPQMVEEMRYLADRSFSEWIIRKYASLPPDPTRHLYGGFIRGMDRIMKFERLQQDFDDVMREIGITDGTEIPVLNVTEGRAEDYREMYSPAARAAVEQAFAADLWRFGYAF